MSGLTAMQRRSIIKKRHKRQKVVGESSKDIMEVETIQESIEVPEIDERTMIEEYTVKLQQIYKENVQKIKDDSSEEARFVKIALIEAEEIWLNIQVLMKSKMYATMNDDQKISLVQKDFAMFYKNFPIVARYMICHGQYNSSAFRKMLINCKNTKADGSVDSQTAEPELKPNDKGKGKMTEVRNPTDFSQGSEMPQQEPVKKDNETLWIERQADYVRFLWEEYQDNKFLQSDSDEIWSQAYKALDKEFREFKELHKKMEQKVKEDALKHKKELLFEMSSRIISGAQTLDKKAAMNLKITLQNRAFKQRFDKTLKELLEIRAEIPCTTSGVGTNEERQKEHESELQQSYYKKNYQKMDFDKLKI
ncbi:MAG: hypothetical protein ACRCZI_01525 [Cetobacterium sp.]